jgi:hypothetical protein
MDSTVDLGTLLAKLGHGPAPSAPVPAAKLPESASRAVPVAVRRTPVPLRTAEPVSSLSPGNLAARWNDFLDALPEQLAFLSGAIRQSGMLVVDLTDVGLTFRPHAAIIHQRLSDELPTIKDALKAFYGVAVAVHLMPVVAPPPEPTVDANERPAATSARAIAPADAEPLPIEQAIIELFKARRVVTSNGGGS